MVSSEAAKRVRNGLLADGNEAGLGQPCPDATRPAGDEGALAIPAVILRLSGQRGIFIQIPSNSKLPSVF